MALFYNWSSNKLFIFYLLCWINEWIFPEYENWSRKTHPINWMLNDSFNIFKYLHCIDRSTQLCNSEPPPPCLLHDVILIPVTWRPPTSCLTRMDTTTARILFLFLTKILVNMFSVVFCITVVIMKVAKVRYGHHGVRGHVVKC